MSATGLIVSYRYSLSGVFPETPRRPSFLNLHNKLNTSAPIYQQGFTAIRALFSGRIDRVVHSKNGKRNFVVHNSVQPGAPIPSGNPSNSWTCWLLGMVLSIVLPFWRQGLTPLQALRNKVDTIVETAELVVDVVEKAAEEVEKIADEVADKLPEGGLKAAAVLIGDIAEETAKDARIADDLIDKVEEVQEEVESFFETVTNQENEAPKEASESN
ncbi:unnamed protein product [Ilex paraguariensis]|uniref:Uncharacterized protein n=1 Tax=Ilex paraguariensis TaxID=185542 RepID=A0ABC8SPM1_9AQUA